MPEYTKSKLKQIKAQYDELVTNNTFNQVPFNSLNQLLVTKVTSLSRT